MLLDVGYMTTFRGKWSDGLTLVESAAAVAMECASQPDLRRAYNIAGALSIDCGFPARATEYLQSSIEIARELSDHVGVISAQSNLLGALYSLGLYQESKLLAQRIIASIGSSSAYSQLAAQAFATLANSSLALRDVATGFESSKAAIGVFALRQDPQGVFNALVCESCWLKCAIELDDNATAEARLNEIRRLATKFNTPRTQLNRDLCETAYEMYAGDPKSAIMKLLKLREASTTMPTLYRDNLDLLIRAYEAIGDRQNALKYTVELVEILGAQQVSAVRNMMHLIRDTASTPIPGKDDAQTLIAFLRSGERPAIAPEHIPAAEYIKALESFAVTSELKEESSGLHMYRVGRLARWLSVALGDRPDHAQAIEHAARLHDIGKLGLPDDVIMNTGALTPEQRQAMQMHCEIGAQMIDETGHPALTLAREVAQSHHERWDGTGYPLQLKGEAIPRSARIAAIAETYDVLTHERAYRPAYAHTEAVAIMRNLAGKQFDPTMLNAFVALIDARYAEYGEELENILAEAGSESSFLQAKEEMTRLVDAL